MEGYNYMEKSYAGDHAGYPARAIFGSENSHTLAAWQAVAQNDYIAGQFLWTGIDYLGEAVLWPSHANEAGLLDLAGFPKPEHYFRKSLWTPHQPMVYLATAARPGGARAKRLAAPPSSATRIATASSYFTHGNSLGASADRRAPASLDFTSTRPAAC